MSRRPTKKQAAAAAEQMARSCTPGSTSEADAEYIARRARNNAAVNRTRAKKRQEEAETTGKVDKLAAENSRLEIQAEKLKHELGFLKDMFVKMAQPKDGSGPSNGDDDDQPTNSKGTSRRVQTGRVNKKK